MVLNVHRNHKAYWGWGRGGTAGPGWGWEVGGRERKEGGNYMHVATLSPPVNDSCIKMSSDESHFNVSLIVRDQVTRQCPQTTTFEEK